MYWVVGRGLLTRYQAELLSEGRTENFFLDQYKIEATLMRTQSAATKLLDHVDGWQKIYSDDIATIHLRKIGTVHTVEPAVDPKAK